MNDSNTNNLVKITEARFEHGHVTSNPEEGLASPVHHKVWVGNDEKGWVEVPYVTNVDIDLRQGDIHKAVITVLFPQVEFEGGRSS